MALAPFLILILLSITPHRLSTGLMIWPLAAIASPVRSRLRSIFSTPLSSFPRVAALRWAGKSSQAAKRGISRTAMEDRGHGVTTKPRVLVISGPTAVGKSRLAEEICRKCNGEIISADSVQVYRGMDIGSAKPTREIQDDIKHHLVDTHSPTEEYNAAIFATEAHGAIKDIISRGKLPVVVGGTGFYIEWLLYGRPDAPPPTAAAAEKASKEVEGFRGNWEEAFKRIEEVDPVSSKELPRNNWYRLKRLLEVYYTGGKPLSDYHRPNGKGMGQDEFQSFVHNACRYDYRCYFLSRPRRDLFRAIDERCEAMVSEGLLQEVIQLVKSGDLALNCPGVSPNGVGAGGGGGEKEEEGGSPSATTPAERSIGYRQSLDLLANWTAIIKDSTGSSSSNSSPQTVLHRMDEELLVFLRVFQSASRNFAQRQLKQFRREPFFHWVSWSPSLADAVEKELGMRRDSFWAERIGDGRYAGGGEGNSAIAHADGKQSRVPSSDDSRGNAEGGTHLSSTGRFPTAAEQKELVKTTKEYITRLTIFDDENARLKIIRDCLTRMNGLPGFE